ncbi:MAG: N-acetyltransferase [Desulfobacterales bacterium]|nr:N-acetyltransferase [Desulfobacterales bacterium]MDX2509363.1 N-acetyltransferase [Desulfobacterales bacterium]
MENNLIIKKTSDSDLKDVLRIQKEAFGYDKESNLVNSLLRDDSAKPLLSLLATDNGDAVGHILFTKALITGNENSISAMILAPLAILPHAQDKGIGGKLIKEGLQELSKSKVDLVFVLGHPGFYPRYGFKPAGALGFEAPYPIQEKDAGAWMVQELKPGVIGNISGKIICADMLNKPEHWRE